MATPANKYRDQNDCRGYREKGRRRERIKKKREEKALWSTLWRWNSVHGIYRCQSCLAVWTGLLGSSSVLRQFYWERIARDLDPGLMTVWRRRESEWVPLICLAVCSPVTHLTQGFINIYPPGHSSNFVLWSFPQTLHMKLQYNTLFKEGNHTLSILMTY